jgi:hypothetical protein
VVGASPKLRFTPTVSRLGRGGVRTDRRTGGSLDPAAPGIAILAALALLRFHVGMMTTLGGAALLGIGWWLVAG